jgi:hypothetical protein
MDQLRATTARGRDKIARDCPRLATAMTNRAPLFISPPGDLTWVHRRASIA